jgi:hypothetical protein
MRKKILELSSVVFIFNPHMICGVLRGGLNTPPLKFRSFEKAEPK